MSLFQTPKSIIKKVIGTIERFTGFFSVIQSDHTYIHQGYGFQYPCTFSLGNAATKGCIIKAPDASAHGRFIHWRPTRVSTVNAAIKVELFEAPTWSGGTLLDGVVNMNRNSDITPIATLTDGAITVTDDGDLLSIDALGAGGNPSKVAGGNSGFENEIVFKSNTEYLLLFTNLTTTTTTVTADLFWYEEAMG